MTIINKEDAERNYNQSQCDSSFAIWKLTLEQIPLMLHEAHMQIEAMKVLIAELQQEVLALKEKLP